MLVTTHNLLDPINLTALIQTLQDYLMVGMMQAYPKNTFVTVALEASPNESDSNTADYTGSIVFSETTTKVTAPSVEDVQAVVQALMLNMAAVQAAVDGNPDIAPNQSARARVEQIIAGNMSAVALSNFIMVVTTSNASLFPVDQAQLTETLEQYLTAGMMEKYPNAVEVLLSGTPNQMDPTNAVDYTGYTVFSDSTPPSFQDMQAWQQELMLDITAVQAAVDGNPAIGQDAQVKRVAVDGIGNQAGTSTSTVALPDFTIVVSTSDDDGAVDQAQLTMTLQKVLLDGIMEEYPNVVAVTLVGNPNQMDPTNAVDYSGSATFSGTIPPAEDVQALVQLRQLDLVAVQAAVNGNPAIGQDARVEQVTVGGLSGSGPSTSTVALTDFTIVVNTRNGTDPVNQAELTTTLQDYLIKNIMATYPNVVTVTLNGTPNQMDLTNAVDYTGYYVFSGPIGNVQARAEELLLRLTDVQAAVDGNPGIGQDTRVEQVAIGGMIGSGPSSFSVALTDFTIVVNTRNGTDLVNQVQLTATLQDYLMAGITEEYPGVAAVTLNGTPNQMDTMNAVDYTGFFVSSGTVPPARDVQAKAEELLLDWTAVQAAVNGNPAIGQNVCIQQVALDGSGGEVVASTSAVSLLDFSIVVTGDVEDSTLTKTLEDYLTAGMMEESSSGDAVTLDGSRTQIDGSDVYDYAGYVTVCNTTPLSAEEVESLERDLMFDLTNVQAAVDAISDIGPIPRVEQVVIGDESVAALSDFWIAIQSDDINGVNQAELARTLEDYLMTGLMQDFPDVEDVVLQPQETELVDSIFFSGYAIFAGSAPDFRDVQSRGRGLLRDTSAVQRAVDSNPNIGENVSVSGVRSVGDDADDDNNKTAKIVGGVVGASAFCLALAVIFMARGRRNSENAVEYNEEAPLASSTPLLPSGVASKSQPAAAAPVIDLREEE
jgi:hypothetical protein